MDSLPKDDFEDWVNPDAPPAFTDVAEGLAFMDAQQEAALAELHAHAREKMALDQDDPTKQQYYMRVDRNTVVQTEEEYTKCQLAGIQMKVVPYRTALQLLKDEDRRKRTAGKAKAKKKASRQARKRNRR